MSAQPKTLNNPTATAYRTAGVVKLYGFAAWLKAEPMVEAELSPAEARTLAIRLLQAAEIVEWPR